ncbi:MAG: choline-sulfatase [Gammaproteobacteria bacterium]|nr:choline-sulfatase [Gammaproteobacteria bacterium]
MVDQLSAFALRAYGGTVCKTPHLDQLMSHGTVFENTYTPYPLCAPARFAMMSGRLPSRIGAYDNGAEFPASIPTIAHYLRASGYYTCLSGKMHFVGPDQYHGFEERLTTEIYPADFSWTPTTHYGDISMDDERRYASGVSTMDTVFDAGPLARSMQMDYDEDVAHCAMREIYRIARSDDQRPFFLTVSLTHPHDPYVTTQKFWNLYSDDEIGSPTVGFIPLQDRDPHSHSLYFHYGQDKVDVTDHHLRRARRGYYAMVSYIDDLFGQIQSALDNSGLSDDTVILFTSDHGDMLGERGMWFKKTLFEPAIRIPLILSSPGQTAKRVKTPVTLVDILPTILELTGVQDDFEQIPMDGHSFMSELDTSTLDAPSQQDTLDHENRPPGKPVFVEHIDGGTIAPRLMVRNGNYKYVYSRAYPPQLYDLSQDPNELNSRAGDPELSDIESVLFELIRENWNIDRLGDEVAADQAARRVVESALSKGRQEIWDFQPRPQIHNTHYVRRGDSFPDCERRGYLSYPESES